MMQMEGSSIVPFGDPPWYTGHPSPYYSETHYRLAEFLRTFVTSELAPWAQEWEEAGKVPSKIYRKCAKVGYIAAALGPKNKISKYLQKAGVDLPGGIPLDQWDPFHDFIYAYETSKLGYTGVTWGLGGGNSIGLPPILNYGSEALKELILPGILKGEIRVCLGITEPQAGSDVAGILTTAEKTKDGKFYIVNGQKKWITNGLWADYITAAVRTGDISSNASGVSVLVIPLNVPGVIRRRMHNSGLAASGSTFLEFDNVKVPISHLLGKENQGFQIIMSNFNAERLGLAIQALALSRVCLEDAYLYALTRETFSQKLMSHQIIRHKIGLMSSQIASTHSWLESLVYNLKVKPEDPSLPATMSLAKVQSARVLEFCVREAQQIFGGLGYSKGGGRGSRVEQISRDMRVFVVGGGSEEILIDMAVRMGVKSVLKRANL